MANATYARIDGGVVAELLTLDAEVSLSEVFSPALHASIVAVPSAQASQVAVGWRYAHGVFSAPAVLAPTKAQLLAYAEAKQLAIMDGGLTVAVAVAGQTTVNVECATTEYYRGLLYGAVQRSGLNPAAILNWEQRDGSVVRLNAAQTQALGLAMANWLQQIFDTRTLSVAPAVAAGTITTTAQIDDPTTAGLPAWPANS